MSGARIRWDMDGFESHLRRMAEVADTETRLAVEETTKLVKEEFVRTAPVGETGKHRDSFRSEVVHIGRGRHEGRGGPTRVYSRAREFGHPRWKNIGGKTTGGKPWAALTLTRAIETISRGPAAATFRKHWARAHR